MLKLEQTKSAMAGIGIDEINPARIGYCRNKNSEGDTELEQKEQLELKRKVD